MIRTPGYRLLVKPEEIKRQTESGIVIEYGGNEKLEKGARIMGEVIDIGPLCWGMDQGKPAWCKVGDKIYWAMYAGKNVVDPETQKEYVILNDEDVVGVLCQ